MKKFMSIVLTGAIALSSGAYFVNPSQQTSLTANAGKYQALEYDIVNGETIKITGCLDMAKGEIVIPETIENLPVTEILGGFSLVNGEVGAFAGKKYITSIVLPNTMRTIKDYAFKQSSVEEINLPEELESLGTKAFYGSNLKSITIPGKIGSIAGNTFEECHLLESVIIEEGIKSMGNEVFENCQSLKSVTIPESVSVMGDKAFSGCNSMQTAVVKSEVLGKEAFDGCESLVYITIENPYCDIYDAPETISESAIIYGYENSTAQAYAEVYGREFRLIGDELPEIPEKTESLKGDANGDNAVTIADAVAILQYLANSDEYPLSEQGAKNADVAGGGDGINTDDALLIQQFDAGVAEIG